MFDRPRTCYNEDGSPKVRYADLRHAKRYVSKGQRPYRCERCSYFHLAKKRHTELKLNKQKRKELAAMSFDPHADDGKRYVIVRFYSDARRPQVMRHGLTLGQAQEHCRRDDTRGDDWFDGYDVDQRWMRRHGHGADGVSAAP